MAVGRRALVIGAGIAAGIAALVIASGASADELEEAEGDAEGPPVPETPSPSPPDAPAHVQDAVAPRSEFPWMTYSGRTAQIQQAINQWRDIVGEQRIAVDGVLGPKTCRAWWSWYRGDQFASIAPPRSCNAYG